MHLHASLASQTWCQIHPFTIHRERLHRLEGHDTCCSIQNYKDLPFTLHNLQPYNICPRRPFNWSPQPGGQTTAAVVKTQRSGKVKILHSLKGLVGGECCGNKDRMAETVPSNRAKLIDVRIRSPYHWWIGLLKPCNPILTGQFDSKLNFRYRTLLTVEPLFESQREISTSNFLLILQHSTKAAPSVSTSWYGFRLQHFQWLLFVDLKNG